MLSQSIFKNSTKQLNILIGYQNFKMLSKCLKNYGTLNAIRKFQASEITSFFFNSCTHTFNILHFISTDFRAFVLKQFKIKLKVNRFLLTIKDKFNPRSFFYYFSIFVFFLSFNYLSIYQYDYTNNNKKLMYECQI